MNAKRFFALALAVVMTFSLVACGSKTESAPAAKKAPVEAASTGEYVASQTTVLKISNGLSDEHPLIQSAYYFEKLLEEALPNRFDVQVYPNASLGDDSAATQDVAMGNLEGVLTPASPVVSLVPSLGIFDMPFLVPSTEAADALLDYMTPLLQKEFEGTGLKLVTSLELGFRNLTNSKRAVSVPDELNGVKIRVMDNAIHLNMWESLGATPVVMAWSELFTAMQQHTVDGQENPVSVIYASSFQEVQSYLTLSEHIYAPYLFFINEDIWNAMTDYEKEVFMDCAQQMRDYEIKLVRETNADWIAELEAAGMEIIEPSSEEKQQWYDACVHIYDDYADQIGADFVKEIQAMMDSYR